MRFLLVLCASFLLFSPAKSQAPSPDHLAAAEELLDAIGAESTFNNTAEMLLQYQFDNNPGLLPFADIVEDYFAEHFSWAVMKDEYARIYADTFSESELRQIAAFYQTEAGQKALAVIPRIMERGIDVAKQRVEQHEHVLDARLQQRQAERDATPASDDPAGRWNIRQPPK